MQPMLSNSDVTLHHHDISFYDYRLILYYVFWGWYATLERRVGVRKVSLKSHKSYTRFTRDLEGTEGTTVPTQLSLLCHVLSRLHLCFPL